MLLRNILEVASVCNGKLINCSENTFVGGVVNNDKYIDKNCCYAAINGKNHKGIDFADSAIENGAAVVLTEILPEKKHPCILVDNIETALLRLATYYRKKERKTVVAVTGSVGKTTVKELCASVLSELGEVLKTDGNKNNKLGVSLTLLNGAEAETAVIEAGISEKGEMSALSEVTMPNIAVITGIGNAHSEKLGNKNEIAKEKLKILENAHNECALIIPFDEPILKEYISSSVTVSVKNPLSDYYADNIRFTDIGSFFDVLKKGEKMISNVFVPIVGEHGVLDALFACAVGDICNASVENIKQGLKKYKAPNSRQNIIDINDIIIVDDCYNSSPEAVKASLSATKIIAEKKNATKTVLVLGDMLELGKESENLHIALGKEIARLKFDVLITIGELAKNISLGALCGGMREVYDFSSSERECAAKFLKNQLTSGAVVLLKGSRKTKMEEFIRVITE